MCRLYGMRASHPTRAACELVDAQNSLIEQAVEDGRGLDNPHGWGIGLVRDGETTCSRQVEPADRSEEFRRNALHSEAETLVAHVRRATVGDPVYENTHPFRHEGSFLAHNGHVGRFDEVKEKLLAELPDEHREAISGSTDSEHVFQLARSYERDADSRLDALRRAVGRMREWTESFEEETELFLNTLWGEGDLLAGTKLERSLWYLERDEPIDCDICGEPHAEPDGNYRSVVFASEQITDEDWKKVPEESLFRVGPDLSVDFEPLF